MVEAENINWRRMYEIKYLKKTGREKIDHDYCSPLEIKTGGDKERTKFLEQSKGHAVRYNT